jgi:NADH:ubiquinone oxidoreductase subunit 3 (subunit A)
VFANIAIIITSEESPAVKDWYTWRNIFHIVDVLCCCAILFPIVWSIKRLRDACEADGKSDGKLARSLEKLVLFRQFYIVVVMFIYFTRIVVFLLESTVDYQYQWTAAAAAELATLMFYTWMGVKFRPFQENAYLKLRQEEIEMG